MAVVPDVPPLAGCGALYVATGEKYHLEAAHSARSLKAAMPELPVALASDLAALPQGGPFDLLVPVPDARREHGDKIAPLLRSPFERTLFLDSDTYVCRPFPELFAIAERFELAFCHDTWRQGFPMPVPAAFVHANSGVLLYRLTPAVRRLFADWAALYWRMYEQGPRRLGDDWLGDQSPLQQVLWDSQVRFYVLPGEYNYRTWCANFVGAQGEVAIIHGRDADLAQLARRLLPAQRRPRVFLPSTEELFDGTLGFHRPRAQRRFQRALRFERLLRKLFG
jgi:hypothetical protein